MHNAELYPDDATAPNAEVASVPPPNNALDALLPHHFNIINSQWLTNFVKWKFSGNQARIVHAIFRHTVGFLKREDDINGSRLEQITGIRYDHANEIVRKLAAQNILILRKGFYGFWTSINFNFSQWNQANIIINPDSNDPARLLPDKIRNAPVDSGYSLDNPTETVSYSNTAPSQNTENQTSANNIANTTENTQIQSVNNPATEMQTTQITSSDLAKIEQKNKDFIVQHAHTTNQEILAAQKNYNQETLTIISEQMGDLSQQISDSIKSDIQTEVSQQITGLSEKIEGLSELDQKIQNLENVLEQQLQINQQQVEEIKQNNQAQTLDKTEIQALIKQEIAQNPVSFELPQYINTSDIDQDTSEEFTAYQRYLELNNLAKDTHEINDSTKNSDLTKDTHEINDSTKNSDLTKDTHEINDSTKNSDLTNDTHERSVTESDKQPITDFEITYKLHFSPKFTVDMRKSIQRLCFKRNLDQPTAEILLHYLELKMVSKPKEVYSPVGYFGELARNIDRGDLDIQEIKAKISFSLPSKSNRKMYAPIRPKQDLSLYYIRLKELKTAYHRAKDQYSHYESYFSQVAEETNISFDDAVKHEDRQNIWNDTVNNLNLTYNAITEYVKDSPI